MKCWQIGPKESQLRSIVLSLMWRTKFIEQSLLDKIYPSIFTEKVYWTKIINQKVFNKVYWAKLIEQISSNKVYKFIEQSLSKNAYWT